MPSVKSIRIAGFKGQSRLLRFSKPRVVLGGGVGVGKTTMMEALRLALLQPTRFGEKGLADLSPDGMWAIEVELAVGKSSSAKFERQMMSGKGQFFAGGVAVSAKDYQKYLSRAVAPLEPHHMDLTAFIDLSGQKRAEHISRLLASKSYTGMEAVQAATGRSLNDWVVQESGGALDIVRESKYEEELRFREVADWSGAPGDLVAGPATEMVNNLRRRLGEQTEKLRGLEATEMPPRGDLAALQKRIKDLSEEIGGLDAQVTAAAETRELKGRLEAGIASSRRVLEKAKGDLAVSEAAGKKAAADLEPAKKRLATAQAAHESARTAHVKAKEAESEARGMISALQVLKERLCTACKAKVLESAAVPDSAPARDALVKAENELALAREAVRVLEYAVNQERSAYSSKAMIIKQREAEEQETLQRLQGVNLADVSMLGELREGLMAERQKVEDQRRQAEVGASLERDLDQTRLAVARGQLASDLAVRLRSDLQRWRDEEAKAGAESVLAPMRAVVRDVYAPDADIEFAIEGQGAGTKCRLYLKHGTRAVAFEHLSGGESVLIGAVFLSTLQSVLEGNGLRFITLDTGELDAEWWQRFVQALPKIPVDFMIVANNHAKASDCPEGVEFVGLGPRA